MARSKPYTKKLILLDLILILCSSGAWLLVMYPRETYRRYPSYGLMHAIIDFLLICCTLGFWLIVMLFQSLRRK